jgi:hypothetical protein
MSARRYIVVIQAEQGYPETWPSDETPIPTPSQPVLHSAVLLTDYDAIRESYDDLCEVAQDMAAALRPFAKTSDLNCTCPEEGHDSCQWCEARHALRAYDEAER